MPIICFRAYQGKVAIWEKPTSGDPMAPFLDPISNMNLVKFHSDLQYLSNSIVQDVTVNHTALAGSTGTGYTVSNGGGSAGSSPGITDGQIRATSINLFSHNLGYPPLYYVLDGDQLVCPFFPVQIFDNRIRTISPAANNTNIIIRETAISSSVALPAITKTYKVIVFREPLPIPGAPLFHAKTDLVTMGHGKVSSELRNIRKATDGFDFYVPTSPIVDSRNGAVKIISANGTEATIGEYDGSFFEVESIKVAY